MYSSFTKIINVLTFSSTSSEQYLRAIWNSVSHTIVLILLPIKLNSQLSSCAFFRLVDSIHMAFCFIVYSLLLGGSAGKESACSARDLGSIPGLGRSPGEGKVYPLQYSGLENSMDCRGHKESDMTEQLSLYPLANFIFHNSSP